MTDIARRHRISSPTVAARVARVRAAGARASSPLHPDLINAATRPSTPTEDHLGRTRIAATLNLPALPAPAVPPRRPGPAVSTSQLAAARVAAQLLAAVGPLDLDTLHTAIIRSRRFRTREPLSHNDLAAALSAIGGSQQNGHWRHPHGMTALARYAHIVAAAGRDLTRQQMIDILIAAGYSRASATGRMSTSHPRFSAPARTDTGSSAHPSLGRPKTQDENQLPARTPDSPFGKTVHGGAGERLIPAPVSATGSIPAPGRIR